MEKELFYAGSATKAVRARNILRKHGISAQIERGYDRTDRGCGYSVLVIESSMDKAREILNKYNLGNKNDGLS
ncbi:MAG: DUF2007 domain-containing protein [Acutalibacteraceae bacterium]|nr:DUF3343 domain-containing protein [Clostridia bacterium]MEE1143756.1 DUF2007 domain-containing protein [Acutalibacteraceae bacterium]